MNSYVADTMAIVLYLENRKHPSVIKNIFNSAERGDTEIYISAVSLMEVGYLSEKQRIEISIEDILNLISKHKNFKILNLDAPIVLEAFKITSVPELHDRLITASAAVLEAILITNDPIIRASGYVKTIW